jgi:hypothetical protein
MKFKYKNWNKEDAVKELEYFKFKSYYGYLVLTHDSKIIFFYCEPSEYGAVYGASVTYEDVTNDFEIIT